METSHKDTLSKFTIDSLPDLDVVTLGALELFAEVELPQLEHTKLKRPLVVGSGNAAVTGRLLFADMDAVFTDESSYKEKLNTIPSIDGAYVISASGSKHAEGIVETLKERGLETYLLTNNPNAPARSIIGDEQTYVFPKNREPYTYNTSTYMGMILAKTGEDPKAIYDFIQNAVVPSLPDTIAQYDAYYLMVPEQMNAVREMFATKFDELFGPQLMGRIFTEEQTKHAKTVIPMDTELFISFGMENKHYGLPENRITIPLPDSADYATMMAVGYFVIGQIQRGREPLFKNRVVEYTREISKIFGKEITPIVE